MAVIVKTGSPNELLAKIYKAIDDKKVDTWSYDADGDLTQTGYEWKKLAWLKPAAGTDELRLIIIPPKESKISVAVYSVYHAQFIEMLLANFDQDFTEAGATAKPAGDLLA